MKKMYGGKKMTSKGGSKEKQSIGTKSWDGRKQSRSSKNKGFGPC